MTCAPASGTQTSRLVLVQPPGPTHAQQEADSGPQLSVWQQQAPADHLLQLLAASRWDAAFAFTEAQGLSSDFVYRCRPRWCRGHTHLPCHDVAGRTA